MKGFPKAFKGKGFPAPPYGFAAFRIPNTSLFPARLAFILCYLILFHVGGRRASAVIIHFIAGFPTPAFILLTCFISSENGKVWIIAIMATSPTWGHCREPIGIHKRRSHQLLEIVRGSGPLETIVAYGGGR